MNALGIVKDALDRYDEGKTTMIQDCYDRWEKSKYLPRKRKKKERKDIILTLAIVQYEPSVIEDARQFFNMINEGM